MERERTNKIERVHEKEENSEQDVHDENRHVRSAAERFLCAVNEKLSR